jgi:hypothetical protein
MSHARDRWRGEWSGSWDLRCQRVGNTTDYGSAEQYEYQTKGTEHTGLPGRA